MTLETVSDGLGQNRVRHFILLPPILSSLILGPSLVDFTIEKWLVLRFCLCILNLCWWLVLVWHGVRLLFDAAVVSWTYSDAIVNLDLMRKTIHDFFIFVVHVFKIGRIFHLKILLFIFCKLTLISSGFYTLLKLSMLFLHLSHRLYHLTLKLVAFFDSWYFLN